MNSATASLYGLDPSKFGADLVQVELDPAQRPGFLTRAGFLNAYSSYNRTSPILRGAFITKQVLAVPIGSPPPGAETTPLPATADLDTNREAGRPTDVGRRLRRVPSQLHQSARLRDGSVRCCRRLANQGEIHRRRHRHLGRRDDRQRFRTHQWPSRADGGDCRFARRAALVRGKMGGLCL